MAGRLPGNVKLTVKANRPRSNPPISMVRGMAACSMPVKILEAEIPPEQYPDMNCDALNAERARLLAERADLNTPLLSSEIDGAREAELTQLNGKLYTLAKAQSDKSCPLVANAGASSVVR
jgi:uncharacterized protein YfaA (DUF2138 family)